MDLNKINTILCPKMASKSYEYCYRVRELGSGFNQHRSLNLMHITQQIQRRYVRECTTMIIIKVWH